MGGMIPLADASRRPSRFPAVTTAIILVKRARLRIGIDGWR